MEQQLVGGGVGQGRHTQKAVTLDWTLSKQRRRLRGCRPDAWRCRGSAGAQTCAKPIASVRARFVALAAQPGSAALRPSTVSADAAGQRTG